MEITVQNPTPSHDDYKKKKKKERKASNLSSEHETHYL